MGIFKKLAHRAKESISEIIDDDPIATDNRKEWRTINKTLNSVGNDMSTKLYSQPVPLRLCRVCAKIDQQRSGWSEAAAVRCPAQLLSPENQCQMCQFFGRYILNTYKPEVADRLLHCRQPIRLQGLPQLDNLFTLDLHDPGDEFPLHPGPDMWVLRSTSRDPKEAQFREELNMWNSEMADQLKQLPDTRIMAPREASEGAVDIELIRSWLYDCEYTHQCTHPIEDQQYMSTDLYLVDVTTRRIVSARPNTRYIILSYVWGDTTRNEGYGVFVADDGNMMLPDKVAQTIEDAITLTSLLGEVYLWVDVYCVEQHDQDLKLAQLMQMDRIFANAMLTIVAVSSPTAESGIPGISRMPGPRQLYCSETRQGFVATLASKSQDIVASSAWNTRGWTFQEEILSKRLLCFSEKQYWLKCRVREYSSLYESDPGADLNPGTDTDPRFLWSRLLATRQPLGRMARGGYYRDYEERKYDLNDYFDVVRAYQDRRLTYSSDILQAFLGVSARTGLMLRAEMRQGLPYNESFHSSLCFTFEKDHYSHQDFPSWSWIGWFGTPDWEPVSRSCRFSIDTYFGTKPTFEILRQNHSMNAYHEARHKHEVATSIMNDKAALCFDPQYVLKKADISSTNQENTLYIVTEMATLRCKYRKDISNASETDLQIVSGNRAFEWSNYTTTEYKGYEKVKRGDDPDRAPKRMKFVGLTPGHFVIPSLLTDSDSDDDSDDNNSDGEDNEEAEDGEAEDGDQEHGEDENDGDDDDDDDDEEEDEDEEDNPENYLRKVEGLEGIYEGDFILIQSTRTIGPQKFPGRKAKEIIMTGHYECAMVWAILLNQKKSVAEDNGMKTYRRMSVVRVPPEIWMEAKPRSVGLMLC